MYSGLFSVLAISIVILAVLLRLKSRVVINFDIRSRRERRNAKLRQRKLWKTRSGDAQGPCACSEKPTLGLDEIAVYWWQSLSSSMHELVAFCSCDSYVVVFCIVACGYNGHVRVGMVVVHGKASSARKKEDRCTFI